MPKGNYKHNKLSSEHKKKISCSLKGRIPWNKGKKVEEYYKHSRKGIYVFCPRKNCRKLSYRYPSQINKCNNYCSKEHWYLDMADGKNPMKGKHHTEESNEQNKIKHLGRKFNEETIKKLRIINRKHARYREKNNFWKGGISGLQNSLRNTWQYKEWRKKIFTRDNYRCRHDGYDKGTNLVAHHLEKFGQLLKKYRINTVEKALECRELWNISNGLTVCHECHELIHGKTIPY
jgi:hypothetical protein